MDQLKSGSEIYVALSTLTLESKWSEKKLHLDDIVDTFELPQIAKVVGARTGSDLEKKVDIDCPFLIYSRRRRTKVVAQLLFYEDKQKAWVVDGPNLEIPKDYTGWFEMVDEADGKISNFYSPCTTIEQIVKTKCRKFLVRSTIVGHKYMEDENGIVFLDEMKIYVGEILKCDGVVKRKWKVLNPELGEISKMPETQFLKCIDPRKNHFCVSVGHPGKFSPIFDTEKGDENPKNAVYQIRDILERESKFPKAVRLAFGWMPKMPLIPRTFQGVIQLVAVVRPDTLVMCSLVDSGMPLVEVPINLDVQVQLDESKDKWLNKPSTKATLRKCYNSVYPFLTSMKIMDIKYKARDIQKSSSGSQKQKFGRMASPLDMNTFNPLDVYPPMIKENDIAETWALSFRDPENATVDDFGNVVMGEVRLSGKSAENGAFGGSDRRSRNRSDLRAIRDKEVRDREAYC